MIYHVIYGYLWVTSHIQQHDDSKYQEKLIMVFQIRVFNSISWDY